MPRARSAKWCILISGGIASGKTTVAEGLAEALGAQHVRIREALIEVLDIRTTDRRALQVDGAALDRRTNGRWLLEYLQHHAERYDRVVVDSVRTRRQTVPVLEGLGVARLVYLDVTQTTREHRFALAAAGDPVKASMDLSTALRHSTEAEVERLRPLADLVLQSDDLTATETVDEIIRALRLEPEIS